MSSSRFLAALAALLAAYNAWLVRAANVGADEVVNALERCVRMHRAAVAAMVMDGHFIVMNVSFKMQG